MSIFDQLTAAFDQRRQADSIYNTVQPYLPGAPAPDQGGGFFSQLLGLVNGGQQPTAPALSAPSLFTPSAAAPAQPFNAVPVASAQPAARPTFPSAISNAPAGTVAAGGRVAPTFAPAPAGPLPTFAAAGGAPGQDSTSKALAFYQSKGLSPLAASALVGGFKTESGPGLNTTAVNVGDGQDGSNSIGVPQWNGDRARGFLNFARSNNLDPSSLDTQLQYSWLELNGPEKGTLQALMNPNLNPGTATAAALGYERPAGWTAQNPYGAKTFGSRLKNTVQLAQGGFSAPFDGSAIGPDPTRFAPDPTQGGGVLPSIIASGLGPQLSPATPLAPLPKASGGGPGAPRGGNVAYAADGKAVITDDAGNAIGSNGQPTTLAYGGVPNSLSTAPAQRAITTAAPLNDPLVTVPGYSGQWNKARIAAAPDGTDVPDDGELARAQSGALGGATRETVQVPTRGPGTANALSPAAPRMQMPAPAAAPMQPPTSSSSPLAAGQASGGFAPISPQMIGALIKNPDTSQFGLALWQNMLTNKTPPVIAHAGDVILDGRTGQPIYSVPNKPEITDAIKNFQFSQTPAGAGFAAYQEGQQKGDKAQLVDVPLPNGQFQKAWAVPGQIPTPENYVGQPYTRQPANQVTIEQKAESAQEQEVGKSVGQEIGETIKAGALAPQGLNQIAMMRAAATQGGDNLSRGPLGQITLKAKQAIGNTLGIEIPGTSEAEVINNLGYGLATQAARAISNRPTQMEFANALAVKPGIAQSPAGFQALLNIREQDLRDQLALAQLASVKANRDNWMQVKADYYAAHPVMSPFDPTQPLGAGDVQAINASAGPDTSQGQSISAQDAATLPVVSSPADAAKLKPGTMFKTPDGRIKQR